MQRAWLFRNGKIYTEAFVIFYPEKDNEAEIYCKKNP